MIYLLIFIYLLYLSIHFDILRKNGDKNLHFKIVIIILILVAGLRWRIGSDTVVYADDFISYHDLFNLRIADFESPIYMPLWVLVNSLCKTIWNDFVLVQFITCFIHIILVSIFIRKVCPSLSFIILLYYYFFEYIIWNMEQSRHSLAVSCFLISLLFLNKKQIWFTAFFWICSVFCHVFSVIAIVSFVLYYKFIRGKKIRYIILFFCIGLVLTNIEWFGDLLTSGFIGVEGDIGEKIYFYAMNDNGVHGVREFVWKRFFKLIFMPLILLFTLEKIEYSKFISLRKDIIEAIIFLYITFQICNFSFGVFYRMSDFFCLISQMLFVVLFMYLANIIIYKQRCIVYLSMILIPIILVCYIYGKYENSIGGDYFTGDVRVYSRYYPYSSIFDKTIDSQREKLHQFRGYGYTKSTDYFLINKSYN